MVEIKRISVDTSKAVFTVHAVDQRDHPIIRRDLKRAGLVDFFAKQAPTEIVLEACGGSHHWARVLSAQGHMVKLIPPQYVKPFVKRGKNDRNDAEAICEAAGRPNMSFVPIKSAQRQAELMVLRTRELLIGQRTQLVNALRGHAAEFGAIAGKGIEKVGKLLELIAGDSSIPPVARDVLAMLGAEIERLDMRLDDIDVGLQAQHKANPLSVSLGQDTGRGTDHGADLDHRNRTRPLPVRAAFGGVDWLDAEGTLDRRPAEARRHQSSG
jgi:transposase